MINISLSEFASAFAGRITEGGLFLTAGHEGKVNAMTIGWGSVGFYWGMPVVIVPVRHSRFTLPLIEKSGLFTVSVPMGDMKKALTICGTKSGRDGDKLALAGVTGVAGQTEGAFIIGEADMFAECRLRYAMDMEAFPLADDVAARWYPKGDKHMMLYGEALSFYKKA